MKKVIYSCITGGYDDVCRHIYVDASWDYVLFTDNKYLLGLRRYFHWEIRPLMYAKMGNVKNARWHKINAHKIFPEYDISLWIDGNIVIMKPEFFYRLNTFIEQGHPIVIPPHPARTCIFDEAKTIIELKIDNKNTVAQQMRIVRLYRYPKNNGLNETCIILRRHNNKKIQKLQRIWWRMVKNYSRRDQLSYNWAAWRCGVGTIPMFNVPGEHRKCDELLFVHKTSHNQAPSRYLDTWVVPRWMAQIMCMFITSRKSKKVFIAKHTR